MKKFLLFLMFALFCIPWAANAQTIVEIGTDGGTTTNSYLPAYTLYNNTLSEQIYTAEEVTMAGTISSISFYNGGSTKSPEIKLYLVNTDKSEFTSTTDWLTVTADDLVFEGTVTFTAGEWTTIVFDNEFAYDGTSNLGVVVDEHMQWSSGLACRVFTSTDNCSLYHYDDNVNFDATNPASGNSSGRLGVKNQIKLEITPSGGTICEKPESLEATNEPENAATLTWTGGSGNYNVEYKLASDAEWTSFLTNTTATTCNLTGLTPGKAYQARVQSVCGDATSGWKSVSFTTACGAITTFPWTETFESYASGNFEDPCWVNEHIEGDGSNIFKIYTSTISDNATHQLQLPDMAGGTLTKLVLPEMTLPENYEFSIDIYRSNSTYNSNNIYEGVRVYASTDGEIEGATELAFIPRQYNTSNDVIPAENAIGWYTYELPIGMSGTCYIILRGESQYCTSTYMDNLTVKAMPACPAPTGLAASDITAHGATITWDAEEGSWFQYVILPTSAYDPESYIGFTTQSMVNTATFTTLDPETSYTFVLHKDCGEDGFSANVSIAFTTAVACPAPTGVTTSNITAHGVTVTWTAEEGAMYQYQMVETAHYDPEDIYWSASTQINPMSWNNLDPETSYTLALRKDCNSANDGYSQVVTTTFTTGEACPAPTGLAASDITGHTATLNWNGTSDSYVVSYRTKAYTEGVYEQFNNSGVPSGWTRYSGLVDDVVAGTATLSSTTSGWSSNQNALGAYNMKVNIWGTSVKYWLVTPEFILDQNLSFDLALTDYGNSDPIEDNTAQADDRFVVLIYANNAWTILREWNNSGSEYVYNNISSTGENVAIDLSAYNGQNVKIAFYGESTASGGDNDLHIDNVFCGTPIPAGEWQTVTANASPATITGLAPETVYEAKVQGDCGEEDGVSLESSILTFTTDVACPAPTNVVMSEITTTTAVIDWVDNAGASAWYITYDPANPDLHQTFATTHPYTLTGLTPDSTYNLQVAAVCGGSDGVSEWSPVVTFTTLPLCQAPTNLDTANVTAHTADMSWTGNGDSYKVYLGACPFYFSTAFANGIPSEMTNDATYPWTLVDGYIKSSNGGVSSSTSAISVTFDYPEDGVIEFDAECKGEGTSSYWDHCDFYIDDTRMLYAGANISGWNHYSFNVTAGLHTFSWKYTKDSSVNPTGDYFAVDNIVAQAGDIVWADPVTAEGEEYSFTGLEGGNTYFVQLQSICGEDESGLSEVFDFTTPISCFVPTEAMVTYTVGITAEVSWTSDAESFNIDLNGTIIENVTNPYTLENLDYSTDYTVKVQAVCGAGDVSKWATAGSFTTEEFCPAPTEFTYALSSDGATVTWDGTSDSYNVRYRALLDPVFSDDFENGIDNWTIVAGATATAPSGGIWYTIDPTGGLSFESHSATYCASSWSWNSSVYQADNWLISPQINLQGVLKYYVRTSSGWPDSYEVRLSTQTNDTASFDVVLKAMAPAPANGKWNEVIIDLSAYDGVSGYIAFHHVDYDMNYLVLDDIGVYPVGDWNTTSVTESTCALTDLELATYEWQVQGVCDGETGAWSSSQFFDFTPVDCEAGIVLNESNNYTWKADFEGITNITKLFTGVTPSCWTVAHEYTSPSINHIGLEADTLPQLYRSFNTTDGGQYSLRMKYRSLLAMPVLDESVDMSRLQMTLNVRQPQTYYKLQIGVMSDVNDESTFVPVATVNNASTSMEEFVCNFSSYNGEGRYIAFKNVGGSKVDPYCSNYLDDIVLTYIDAESCKIPVPYSQDFESFTTSGGASGVEPDCWEVISEDVSLDATTRPQVYRGFNTTAGGHYSLRMKNRCVYAMPEFAENINVKELTMTFKLRQAKSFYRLEVGVVDADGNFVVVEEINNPSTSMEDVTVDFSSLEGDGFDKRIAFHNILRNSANYDYSYNYIDDIELNYTADLEETSKAVADENGDMDINSYLESIAVYPNPTTGVLHIDAMDVQKVECYSQMGQLVGVYDNVNELNISELANGVYMLRITVPQGVTMRKVVKR